MSARIFNLPSDPAQSELILRLAESICQLSQNAAPDEPAAWFVPISGEPLDVDPARDVDPLVANVFQFLHEHVGGGEHGARAWTFEKRPLKAVAVHTTAAPGLESRLCLVHYEDSIYAFVSGSSAAPTVEAVTPWRNALAFAVTKQADGHPLHQWSAVVGISDPCRGNHPKLDRDSATVGPLTLETCHFSYEERRAFGSLCGWRNFRWVPVLVKGATVGHHFEAALFTARSELHRLCALLSLESGCHWSLKESPQLLGIWPPTLPVETPRGLRQAAVPQDKPYQLKSGPMQTSRMARIWKRCSDSEGAAAPLEAYYQAASLRESHPSFALMAFVGAIEEAGKFLMGSAHTERCTSCQRELTNSSAERFRRALKLVLPEDKAALVSREFYKWRSGTAHAARTFGWEQWFGQAEIGDSLLVASPQSLFTTRGPDYADELAQSLLLRLLDDAPLTSDGSETL